MADDGRSLPNAALLETSFLYGANAAFMEDMYARYMENPASVDPSWQAFFRDLADAPDAVRKAADGPSWYRPDLALPRASEATAVLDGNWDALTDTFEKKLQARLPNASIADVQAAARDSVRALMMIRTYRMRGHLAARLDPLNLSERENHEELDPASYGFGPADRDRPIFIDGVLGLDNASVNQMLEILQRT